MSEERIKELESQLSQYKAHVERLNKLAEKVHDMFYLHGFNGYENLANEASDLLSQSPATSLAQVEADAIMLLTTSAGVFTHEYTGEQLLRVSDLIEYANNLKEQG